MNDLNSVLLEGVVTKVTTIGFVIESSYSKDEKGIITSSILIISDKNISIGSKVRVVGRLETIGIQLAIKEEYIEIKHKG